jgi:hypothetical protein
MKMDIMCIDFSKRSKINELIQLVVSESIARSVCMRKIYTDRVFRFENDAL